MADFLSNAWFQELNDTLESADPVPYEFDAPTVRVVIEFPDYATALACYRSPEYQENIKRRLPHAVVDLLVIEGYDDPQP